MAHRKSFYLYQRHKKGGDYWYVCYLDKETGKQQSAKSIDCLKARLGIMDFQAVKSRDDAVIIAQKAMERGILSSSMDGDRLFVDYCKDFWDYDKSNYILMRNKLCPNSIGKEYAYNMQKGFLKHVAPLVPRGLRLSHVTTKNLDDIMQALFRSSLAVGTIQILEYSFKIPLKEATRIGVFLNNPADRLLHFSKEEKMRGAFSREEVTRLRMEIEKQKETMFSSYRLGVLLALVTGMRCSEIRALHNNDIVPCADPRYERILIRHSLGYMSGIKSTKSKYERSVLICHEFADVLRKNASKNGIIFPSKQSSKGYISSPALRACFYELLHDIGISEEERIERGLTFHSLRHTFSTLSRDFSISQEDRMLVLGHKSKEINDRYTHASEEALLRVSSFSEDLYRIQNV